MWYKLINPQETNIALNISTGNDIQVPNYEIWSNHLDNNAPSLYMLLIIILLIVMPVCKIIYTPTPPLQIFIFWLNGWMTLLPMTPSNQRTLSLLLVKSLPNKTECAAVYKGKLYKVIVGKAK